ncbi:protein PSK SIMULATOR 1-like [Primulina tabacum]|uniref:protein PSK SIMULATOR 1-like n=1 Tax=Primulina tabacum TaxID=48773 RepID=UPI003F5AB3FE
MVGETGTETWFNNIWKNSRKSISWEPERPVMGILSFEISRLMSKVVNLWRSLSDGQIVRLREKIINSVGIRKLVSQDESNLMDLALAEMIANLRSMSQSVAVLGKKCAEPKYHNLEKVFDDLDEIDPKWYGWQYRLKKIERKVKKMDRFIAATEQLYQELDVLVELEQTLRRMRAGADVGQVKLLEFQQKVVWQRQEVKNLQEMSPWIRTYDYIVRLLLRSLFTIAERIKYVYHVNHRGHVEGLDNDEHIPSDCLLHTNSINALLQTPVYPSENNSSRFLGRTLSNLDLSDDKSKLKNKKLLFRSQSTIRGGKPHQVKGRGFAPAGLAGCMTGTDSPIAQRYTSSFRGSSTFVNSSEKDAPKVPILSSVITPTRVSIFNFRHQVLSPPPSTLGYAALALHFANVIILTEKLASSPHLISLDARDDLYNMLPATIKSCLRAKLKNFSRTSSSFFYDDAFAAEWSLALTRILEWLSPLAHNMIKWQSERNIERRRLIYGSNVLLVQTLYFANQVETEAAIVELLIGLNYLSRFGREIEERPFRMSTCSRAYDGYMLPRDNISYDMIDI